MLESSRRGVCIGRSDGYQRTSRARCHCTYEEIRNEHGTLSRVVVMLAIGFCAASPAAQQPPIPNADQPCAAGLSRSSCRRWRRWDGVFASAARDDGSDALGEILGPLGDLNLSPNFQPVQPSRSRKIQVIRDDLQAIDGCLDEGSADDISSRRAQKNCRAMQNARWIRAR